MKKVCNECNIEMIDSIIHTDYAGGRTFETQIRVSFPYGSRIRKSLFGKESEVEDYKNERVKAVVCPNCGKVELYIDTEQLRKAQ